jgi:hypothetical protein
MKIYMKPAFAKAKVALQAVTATKGITGGVEPG